MLKVVKLVCEYLEKKKKWTLDFSKLTVLCSAGLSNHLLILKNLHLPKMIKTASYI